MGDVEKSKETMRYWKGKANGLEFRCNRLQTERDELREALQNAVRALFNASMFADFLGNDSAEEDVCCAIVTGRELLAKGEE